ncbi:MAG: dihydrofolate synthase [Actinobacteria bacterium]|nr:dihydrofolate synthase [Actinomycetota bacterium]
MEELTAALLARAPETDMEPTLARVERVLDMLGSPQQTFRSVHITGTNGKTSTARMAETMLRAGGLRTGLYTSPHLHSIGERICIDGEPLLDERMLELFAEIEPYVQLADEEAAVGGQPPLTFFEVLTILAFAAFADAPVEVAVVEVGLGGVWDATNVMDADVAVVTPISEDHTAWLGTDVAQIAAEKSGIIKQDCTAVLAAQVQEAADVLLARCAQVHARVMAQGRDFDLNSRTPGVGGQLVSVRLGDVVLPEVFVPLLGVHQAQNALLATAAVAALLTEDLDLADDVVSGLESVVVPARLEQLGRSPTVLVDAAHNPAGARVLAAALREDYSFDSTIGVVAIMADKDLPGILEALAPVLDRVILTRNSSERSASLAALREAAAGLWDPESLLEADSVAEALEEAVVLSGSGRGGVVVTGSVVTAADARKATGHQDFGTIPSIATVGLEDPDDADESEGQQLLEEPEEDL